MATLNVFITNLGAYAAGELRGEWLGLPASEEVQDGAYTLIEGVDNVEDLGYYCATETGAIDELPDWARGYFDYEAYGRDISIEANGEFVGAGWIEKTA